jgi:hypothetical protein
MGYDDYKQRRQQWLAQIEAFYTQVLQWLGEYADKGMLRYEFLPLLRTEELLGSYTTRSMKIKLGSQRVTLTPVGATLGSDSNRIDLEGHRGKVRFVLTGTPQPTWKIAGKAEGGADYADFNTDNFFEALLEVSSD